MFVLKLTQNCKLPFSILRPGFQHYLNYSQAANQVLALQKIEMCADPPSRALILGVYADENSPTKSATLTSAAWKYNMEKTHGRLLELLRISGPMPKIGEARLLFAVEPQKVPYYSTVAVVGLGKDCLGFDSYEGLDFEKEAIRRSIASACITLQHLSTDRIDVDCCGHAESAAEGAALGVWAYQELKDPKERVSMPTIDLYIPPGEEDKCDSESWKIGLHKAGAQNLTRQLQETPSNILTPTSFAQNVVEVLCTSGINVEVKVEGWAENQRMNSFLGVARASCEAPIFLELSYYGAKSNDRPIVLIGQGVTHNCGGLNLNELENFEKMRADMTGAAVVVATCRAIADMKLPVNIRGLIPLCENTLGCNAFKPGDVFQAMNGKSIQVQRTNFDGILLLADALLYAQNFCPKFIIDVGTNSDNLKYALDEAACAIFTNSELLWQQIKHASMHTGDRVWRFPLWQYYGNNVKNVSECTDVFNDGICRGGQPCKTAAFLKEFVPCGQWMHIDAHNVIDTNGCNFEYLREGMAGRPTRTLIEFIAQTVCSDILPKEK